VEANIESVLAETYPNTEFTITDAGSKMEAAAASNEILQLLLKQLMVWQTEKSTVLLLQWNIALIIYHSLP